jgi:D-tyrosyl-tRNA(Tyr) deacylase
VLTRKIEHLRIFPDERGRMNRSVVDVDGAVLVVSQFTLCADVRRGNRPSFTRAAEPDQAARLVERVAETLAERGIAVASGAFGERMLLSLVNEGPVTIVIDVDHGRVVAT